MHAAGETMERGDRLVVAVDAMGGDHGPAVVVPGAVDAARDPDGPAVALYGDPEAIGRVLAELDAADLPVAVVPCSQQIGMGEHPAAAIKNRPDAPVVRAFQDHRAGDVHAVVSAGSTGAMAAGGLLLLGRLPGVERPAIGTVIPTLDRPFLLLDAGANVQATPEQLLAFARMGEVFARLVLEVAAPRVALLNIGEEPTKGTDLTVRAHALLAESGLPFAGNIEGRDLLLGRADVVVTDGFTGNVVLKTLEGLVLFLQAAARAGGGDTASGSLAGLMDRMDYTAYGGALLLGVRGNPVIAHGSSNRRAIANAVRTAARLARRDVPRHLAEALSGA